MNEALLHARLKSVMQGHGSSITAWSGGVDSTLVAFVAKQVHQERALSVTGISASLAKDEYRHALELATKIGLSHRCVDTHELSRPGYVANAGDRCYHCKGELFDRLQDLAQQEGYEVVYSGENLDDLGTHRPGHKAAKERGVQSPLVLAEFDKAAVRKLAAYLKLPNHAKPAAPCLASRIPDGTRVDAATLAMIDAAESALRRLGLQIFRVRHHGALARIEVSAKEMVRAFELRVEITTAVREAGYKKVALELTPFRSGSLHVLGQSPQGALHG